MKNFILVSIKSSWWVGTNFTLEVIDSATATPTDGEHWSRIDREGGFIIPYKTSDAQYPFWIEDTDEGRSLATVLILETWENRVAEKEDDLVKERKSLDEQTERIEVLRNSVCVVEETPDE